jgi:hypothetical protein
MTTISDLYADSEFEDLLSEAENNASGTWEIDFVTDMRDKWEQYGHRMFLSDKQNEILNRIANDD